MNFKIKFPPKKNKKYIENFFKKKGLYEFIRFSKKREQKINELEMQESFKPELDDLYRLY